MSSHIEEAIPGKADVDDEIYHHVSVAFGQLGKMVFEDQDRRSGTKHRFSEAAVTSASCSFRDLD